MLCTSLQRGILLAELVYMGEQVVKCSVLVGSMVSCLLCGSLLCSDAGCLKSGLLSDSVSR